MKKVISIKDLIALLALVAVLLLAGCEALDLNDLDLVMQDGTSSSTTIPVVGSTTTVPTTRPTTQPTTVTTVPTTAPTTIPTTVPAHTCTFTNYVSDGNAKCEKDGTKTARCDVPGCPKTKTVTDEGSALGHLWLDYVWEGWETCVEDGMEVAICERDGCGAADPRLVPGTASGHDMQYVKTVEATLWTEGYDLWRCTVCRHTEKKNFFDFPEEDRKQFLREIEDSMFKYINQWRAEEGNVQAERLIVMSGIARYRAEQLKTHFSHDELEDTLTLFKYGAPDAIDADGNVVYTIAGNEAIAAFGPGPLEQPDDLAYAFANQIRQSANHWAYVGAADPGYANQKYIGIGVEFDTLTQFTICILVSRINYEA